MGSADLTMGLQEACVEQGRLRDAPSFQREWAVSRAPGPGVGWGLPGKLAPMLSTGP